MSLALEAFASHLSGFKVIWYTDNQNVESIILSGSRKADLYQLALRVFQVCLKFRILLDVKWIRRDLNTKADAMSKLIDHDDYTINDERDFFQNGCAAAPRLGHDNNWICPPVCLLIRALKHMKLCKERGTVIFPLWKSSCLCTLFCRGGVFFYPSFQVKERNSLFGSRPLDFDVIALRIDVRCPRSIPLLCRFLHEVQ